MIHNEFQLLRLFVVVYFDILMQMKLHFRGENHATSVLKVVSQESMKQQ